MYALTRRPLKASAARGPVIHEDVQRRGRRATLARIPARAQATVRNTAPSRRCIHTMKIVHLPGTGKADGFARQLVIFRHTDVDEKHCSVGLVAPDTGAGGRRSTRRRLSDRAASMRRGDRPSPQGSSRLAIRPWTSRAWLPPAGAPPRPAPAVSPPGPSLGTIEVFPP